MHQTVSWSQCSMNCTSLLFSPCPLPPPPSISLHASFLRLRKWTLRIHSSSNQIILDCHFPSPLCASLSLSLSFCPLPPFSPVPPHSFSLPYSKKGTVSDESCKWFENVPTSKAYFHHFRQKLWSQTDMCLWSFLTITWGQTCMYNRR